MVNGYEFGFSGGSGGEDGLDLESALLEYEEWRDGLEGCENDALPDGQVECRDKELWDDGASEEWIARRLEELVPDRPSKRKSLSEMNTAEIGREGEALAARFLLEHGYDIAEMNWSMAGHEADIVAIDADEVVLIEVKTRVKKSEAYPDEIPELAIDERKRAGYRMLALMYMAVHPEAHHMRFDVIAINLVMGAGARVRHLISAYGCDE